MSQVLENVTLVAGFTTRSQAYLQAMLNSGFEFQNVILFGSDKGSLPGQTKSIISHDSDSEIFLPNLSEDLKETLRRTGSSTVVITADNVNSLSMVDKLEELSPEFIVYSGYGGQIVRPCILDIAPVIHMHSGWLPNYRGSTTMYYSWIKENFVGVSALKMSEEIDQGDIFLRKRYSAPNKGLNPDYIYDAAVRADTLVSLIEEYQSIGRLPDGIIQDENEAQEYYIIHPVLKHLALLKQEKQQA